MASNIISTQRKVEIFTPPFICVQPFDVHLDQISFHTTLSLCLIKHDLTIEVV